ncbi:hypothetical protein ABG067_007726 [Albugo candida]
MPKTYRSTEEFERECSHCGAEFTVKKESIKHARKCSAKRTKLNITEAAARPVEVQESTEFEGIDFSFDDDYDCGDVYYGSDDPEEPELTPEQQLIEEIEDDDKEIPQVMISSAVENEESRIAQSFTISEEDSKNILRYVREIKVIPPHEIAGIKTFYKYCTSPITRNTCIYIHQMVKETLIDSKKRDLELWIEQKRNAGELKAIEFAEVQNYVHQEISKVQAFTYNNSATKLAQMTKDFVKVTTYKACLQGCTLFKLDDADDKVCELCKTSLTNNSSNNNSSNKDKESYEKKRDRLSRKKQDVYYIHLKGQIKSMFIRESFRESLRYGANYKSSPGVYSDVYDGEVMKEVMANDNNQLVQNQYFIYVGLMQDGFTSRQNHTYPDFNIKTHSFTLFQLVCYSLSPALRYKSGFKFQVLCSPGPKKPNMASYIVPIVQELEELYKGFGVNVAGTNYQVFVRPILCIGDTPAVSEIFNHKGTVSYYPCRFCTQRATTKKEHNSCEMHNQRRTEFKARPLIGQSSSRQKVQEFIPLKNKGTNGLYLPCSNTPAPDRVYKNYIVPDAVFKKREEIIKKLSPSERIAREMNRGIAKLLLEAFSSKKFVNPNAPKDVKNAEDRLPFGSLLHRYIYPFTLRTMDNDDDIIGFINKEIMKNYIFYRLPSLPSRLRQL